VSLSLFESFLLLVTQDTRRLMIYKLQTLTADLYDLGYTNQTSIDFSRVAIDAMKSKYSHMETRWCVMDVRCLELPNGSVDVAIDKGTLDAMIHGSLWDPPEDVRCNVGKYVDEVEDRFSHICIIMLITDRLRGC
jgi:hypothetical protein